jgi:glycosyltransferase involved in cell wall biosynthesis
MPARIRVLHLIYSFGIEGGGGGIGRFVSALSQALDPERVNARIGALWHTGSEHEDRWIESLNAVGIPAFTAAGWDGAHPYRSFRLALGGLRRRLAQSPVDILHSHSEFSDAAALLLQGFLRPPAAMRTVHYGYQFEWRKRPWRRLLLTNLLYPLRFSAEVGVSQAITDTMNRRPVSRLLGREAQCIYNAIDLDRFQRIEVDRAAKKRLLGLPAEAIVIGSVGRLTEQKGYRYFVEAAAHVLARLPEARFLLIGDGELAGELNEQAQRLSIAGRLIFTGPRRDVEELLPCLDLFVSSSLWEGLPTVILEGMASGVPVVATDIPGTRELVRPGETGWLAPPADGMALGEVIIQALADSTDREYLRAGAAKILHQFSIKTVAGAYEQIYDRIKKG